MAYYTVAIFYLPSAGYRIVKTSGATDTKGSQEQYWRPNLKTALHKKQLLLAAKLRKKTDPRQYVETSSSGLEIGEEK